MERNLLISRPDNRTYTDGNGNFRPVDAVPGEPVNFCTGCGCPVTSEAVRERIVDLMLKGIRDDMREAVVRLEHDEPEKYGRLAAIVAGGSG